MTRMCCRWNLYRRSWCDGTLQFIERGETEDVSGVVYLFSNLRFDLITFEVPEITGDKKVFWIMVDG